MSMSGQRSECSIRSYSRNVSESTRQQMSLALAKHMTGDLPLASASEEQIGVTVQTNSSQEITVRSSQEYDDLPLELFTDSQLQACVNLQESPTTDTNIVAQNPTPKYMYQFTNCTVHIANS